MDKNYEDFILRFIKEHDIKLLIDIGHVQINIFHENTHKSKIKNVVENPNDVDD